MKRMAWLGMIVLLVACTTAWAAPKSPNFVLLFADDLGYGDLSCYGHPTIYTPHLDRMATQGIKLTSFYAATCCSPSRASLLTGRYAPRTGVYRVLFPKDTIGLPASEVTLAEALKERGYRTACIGKWHLGHREGFLPNDHGFDEYFGLLYSNDMMKPWVNTDEPLKLYRNKEAIEYPVKQETLTDRYTDEAIKFIRKSKDSPFFLYLPYTMPHLPLAVSEKFKGRSYNGLYGDVIETIDWSVGQILQVLQEEGLDDNTLVVFTSDNGPWTNPPKRMLQNGVERWHAGLPGPLKAAKGSTYEGGMRVPCIVRWPGRVPEGQVSAEIASTMDLYTTFIKLAGGEVPSDRPVDGIDIFPLLAGKELSPRDHLFYFNYEKAIEAIRVGPWKLRQKRVSEEEAETGGIPPAELFNLEVDPGEKYNVAQDYPKVVAALQQKWKDFSSEFYKSLRKNAP